MTGMLPPVSALVELVSQRASGEFVCATSTDELHVYLQGGRIAWATDSGMPFAFSRHLLANTSISKDAFQEVLETCRRERLPLGETLIAWRLATLEEIRASLRHQIECAIATLRRCERGRTIFLERRREFASYDTRLTFSGEEILQSEPARVLAAESDSRPPDSLIQSVRPRLLDATWLEVLDGLTLVEQEPPARSSRIPSAVVESTLLTGADLVALRTVRGTIVGVALKERTRSLWCRVDHAPRLGTVVAELCALADIEQRSTPAPPAPGEPQREIRPLGGAPAVADTIRAFMARAPELVGVLLATEGRAVAGATRGMTEAQMLDVMTRRAPALDVLLTEKKEDAVADLEEMGYRLNSIMTGENGVWCFGAELAGSAGATLWMFTERRSAQGLGWAYLTSLVRQIGAIPTDATGSNR